MLLSTGNINQDYEVLGVVHAVVSRPYAKAKGCSGRGGLPIREAYEDADRALADAAARSSGDGVIHIGYDYRESSSKLGCNQAVPVFELYAWGTAIKLR